MSEKDETLAEHHEMEVDVYLGLDDLSSALGSGVLFVGLAMLIVTVGESGEASPIEGWVMTALGLAFLTFAVLFSRARRGSRSH
jgi:hypothetical protein